MKPVDYMSYPLGVDVVVHLVESPDADPKHCYVVGTVTRGGKGTRRTVVWNGAKIRASTMVGEPDIPVILGVAPRDPVPGALTYKEAMSILAAGKKYYKGNDIVFCVAADEEVPEKHRRG